METTLIFAGVAVSLIIEVLKQRFSLSGQSTMLAAAGVASAAAIGYFYLLKFGLLESFMQIATVAGAFYAFIIKNIKDNQTAVISAGKGN